MPVTRSRGVKAQTGGARVGLAVAAGGPMGGIYEAGALLALDEALDGVDFNDLHAYVGVSAGALIAAGLANRFSTSQIVRIFVTNESEAHPFRPERFLRPAFREYLKRAAEGPTAVLGSVMRLLREPANFRLLDAFSSFSRMVPTGLFDNEPLHELLADLFSTRGRSNDFRRLKSQLFVIAVDLDKGRTVKFGAPGFDHVPISKACQASAAMPGLYPPVEIDGRYYADGALKTTMHASVALDAGADLVIGINPIVPFKMNLGVVDARREHDKLVDGGLPVVLSQTIRAIIHSRMKASMTRYADHYPHKDVLLFEPNRDDSRMFFSNPFRYASRRNICQHAYRSTRLDLIRRRSSLTPVLRRHGISLRRKVLRDPDRHFSEALQISGQNMAKARYRNPVTNALSATLDDLQTWLDRTD